MKIYETELCIVYDLNGDLFQLKQSTFSNSTLKVSILDKEQDKSSGETVVEFNSVNELKNCISDFENKFKELKTKRTKTK